MSTAGWIILVVVAALLIAFRKQIGRLLGIGQAVADEAVAEAEGAAALQLRQKAIDDAAETIRTNRETVISADAAISTMTRDLDTTVNECGTLEAKVKKYGPELKTLEASGQGESARAVQLRSSILGWAKELQGKMALREQLESSIATNRASMNRALERIKEAKSSVDAAQKGQADLKVKLDLAKFNAQMTSMTDTLSQGGNPTESIDAATRRVNEQIDKHLSRARVVQATNADDDFNHQVDKEMKDQSAQALVDSLLSGADSPAGKS